MTCEERTIIYTPAGPQVTGERRRFRQLRMMLDELSGARGLIWQLFVRDFRARYRQSVLGVAWAVLMPLATIGMFVAMNRSGIVAFADVGVPYPLYALTGLSLWFLFTTGVTACSTALLHAGSMVSKINFPKSSLIFAAAGQGAVEFLVRVALTAAVFIFYGITPSWSGLLLGLIFVIPLCFLMLGIGFILSLLAVVIRDVVNALGILLFGLMFLTPILYPLTGDTPMAIANIFNPINYLVNVPRDLILYGHSRFMVEFYLVSLLALGIFFFGWRLFFLVQPKIAERI